jgi:hypothetical protein
MMRWRGGCSLPRYDILVLSKFSSFKVERRDSQQVFSFSKHVSQNFKLSKAFLLSQIYLQIKDWPNIIIITFKSAWLYESACTLLSCLRKLKEEVFASQVPSSIDAMIAYTLNNEWLVVKTKLEPKLWCPEKTGISPNQRFQCPSNDGNFLPSNFTHAPYYADLGWSDEYAQGEWQLWRASPQTSI